MVDLRFSGLFNSISVISGRCEVDNERLCAMELRLRLRRFRFERGSNSVRYISRPALNPLSYRFYCSLIVRCTDINPGFGIIFAKGNNFSGRLQK